LLCSTLQKAIRAYNLALNCLSVLVIT